MKEILAIVMLAVLLTGCATQAGFEKKLSAYVGSSTDRVVSAWGVPAGTYKSGDAEYLMYTWSNSGSVPITSPTTSYSQGMVGGMPYGGWTYGTRTSNVNFNFWCKWTFIAVDGRVVKWNYEGNKCVADEN
jgi:hypothetical protein